MRHGHSGQRKRVDVPWYPLKSGDTVIIRDGSRENPTILHAREEVRVAASRMDRPRVTRRKVVSMPTREQINLPVQEQLIVELH